MNIDPRRRTPADTDTAIAAIRERAADARATNDFSDGQRLGVMLTRYELAAVLERLGYTEEAMSTMSITYGIPDDDDLPAGVLTAMSAKVVTVGVGGRMVEINMDNIEAARDAVGAWGRGALPDVAQPRSVSWQNEWVNDFLHATIRFDKRIRAGDRMGTYVSAPPPVNDCAHANAGDPEAGWKCGDCDRVVAADGYDEVVVRQCNREACSSSGTPFLATEGRNCPECSSPFTARVADVGCDECEGESGMEKIMVRVCPDCDDVVEVAS